MKLESIICSPVPVLDVRGRDKIRHRIIPLTSREVVYVQEGELVAYGDTEVMTRSSAKIAMSVLYRDGVFTRAILTYSVQSYGYSTAAVLMVDYEDAGLQGGVFPIMKIRGGTGDRMGDVKIPPRFDGTMTLNDAKITVPPNIAPAGDRYMVSIAMGTNICTFVMPRTIEQVPTDLSFSSELTMASTLQELIREPKRNAKED